MAVRLGDSILFFLENVIYRFSTRGTLGLVVKEGRRATSGQFAVYYHGLGTFELLSEVKTLCVT
jgi:hypothetical protein